MYVILKSTGQVIRKDFEKPISNLPAIFEQKEGDPPTGYTPYTPVPLARQLHAQMAKLPVQRIPDYIPLICHIITLANQGLLDVLLLYLCDDSVYVQFEDEYLLKEIKYAIHTQIMIDKLGAM